MIRCSTLLVPLVVVSLYSYYQSFQIQQGGFRRFDLFVFHRMLRAERVWGIPGERIILHIPRKGKAASIVASILLGS